MRELRECAICGAAYLNATKHQRFHDEVDELIDKVIEAGASESVGRRRRSPEEVRTGSRRGPG
jgi:hypothetical protein